MWPKKYQNAPADTPFVQQPIETGKAIRGVEMHETFGWQEKQHRTPPPPPSLFSRIKKFIKRKS